MPELDSDTPREGPPPVAYRRGHSPFRAAPRDKLLERALPVSAGISDYRPPTARRDLLAGVTVAALALPYGMAYAEVAGLSPVYGLYALLLPAVLYTLLGSSRQLIVGPEGAISALVGAAVVPMAAAGSSEASELAAMLALLVGACFLLAWVIRLGWLADYFSRPVLVGYIHGVAIVLVCGQLGKLLGLDVDASKPIRQVVEASSELANVSVATLLVSTIALGALVPARFFLPRLPASPEWSPHQSALNPTQFAGKVSRSSSSPGSGGCSEKRWALPPNGVRRRSVKVRHRRTRKRRIEGSTR